MKENLERKIPGQQFFVPSISTVFLEHIIITIRGIIAQEGKHLTGGSSDILYPAGKNALNSRIKL